MRLFREGVAQGLANAITLAEALAVGDALRLLTRTSLRSFCPLFRRRKRGRKVIIFLILMTLKVSHSGPCGTQHPASFVLDNPIGYIQPKIGETKRSDS